MNINKTWPSYFIVMVKYDIILLIHTVYSSCLVSQEELGKLWTRLESFFSYIDKYHLEWLSFFDFDRNNIYNSNNPSPLAWECLINWNNYLLFCSLYLCKYILQVILDTISYIK
jgi:hypothetical protein